MKEILKRRVKSFEKNPPPDMIVLDGGKAVLQLAYDIIQSNGVNIELVAITKEKIDAKTNRAKGKAKDLLYYITHKGDIKC
jgi:excinuclease ABC subunit C